jgi:hypothetical protein
MGATLSFLLLYFIKSLLFPLKGSNTTSRNFPQNAPVSSPRRYNKLQMASLLKIGKHLAGAGPPQGSQVHYGNFSDEGAGRRVGAEG